MLRALLVLLLVGCESNPSVLDDLGTGIPPAAHRWRLIEARAQPLSARLDLLHAAVRGPRAPDEIVRRCDELVAWMDARGSVPAAPLMAAFYDSGVDGIFGLMRACVTARPADDRTFEALLYAAARMRGDGAGIIDGIIAGAITKYLAEQRPLAPSFAVNYAPTDAEVFRLFAAEAIFARRATQEARVDSDADLALHESLANAPLERAAFLAYLDAEIAKRPDAPLGKLLATWARKSFATVDAYRAWIAAR